jgi:hypothetical protein
MKRVLLALIAGLLTFSGVYGMAASLNLTTDSLGAATTTVAACQAAALNASYTSTYSAAAPGYTVGTVTVSGLAATCYSKPFKVTLAGAAGASLGESTGTTPAIGTTTSADVTASVNANERIYLKFDLSACAPAVPASAIVRLATLRLYLTALPATCRTLDLFPVTATWTETLITWNNQPFGTSLNNPVTGARTASFTVGSAVGCQNQVTGTYVTGPTVTTDVASFVSGGSTNFGWMIRDDGEGAAPTRTTSFSTKELGTVAQEPQLVVTYATVP